MLPFDHMRRNRVLGYISGSTTGVRAVRRSESQPRSQLRRKTVAVCCCADDSVCAWTRPSRGWRRGGAASRLGGAVEGISNSRPALMFTRLYIENTWAYFLIASAAVVAGLLPTPFAA